MRRVVTAVLSLVLTPGLLVGIQPSQAAVPLIAGHVLISQGPAGRTIVVSIPEANPTRPWTCTETPIGQYPVVVTCEFYVDPDGPPPPMACDRWQLSASTQNAGSVRGHLKCEQYDAAGRLLSDGELVTKNVVGTDFDYKTGNLGVATKITCTAYGVFLGTPSPDYQVTCGLDP